MFSHSYNVKKKTNDINTEFVIRRLPFRFQEPTKVPLSKAPTPVVCVHVSLHGLGSMQSNDAKVCKKVL